MITRRQYLDGDNLHDAYYSQFVTENIRRIVVRAIGGERILKSSCPHFNDIPLKEWDSLEFSIRPLISAALKQVGDCGCSLSDCVCTAKQAARIWRDSQNATN